MKLIAILLLVALLGVAQSSTWENIDYLDLVSEDGGPLIAEQDGFVTGRVKFHPRFKQPPRVLLTIQSVNQEEGAVIGFVATVESVDTKGFYYKIVNKGTSALNSIRLQWFATLQSNIQFFYFNVDVSEIDMNEMKLFWPSDIMLPYEEIIGSIFLLGYQFENVENPFMLLNIKAIDPYGVNVLIGGTGQEDVGYPGTFVSFVIVASNDQFFDPFVTGRDEGYDYEDTLNYDSGYRELQVAFSIEGAANFPENERIFLQGLSGLQFDQAGGLKVGITNEFEVEGTYIASVYADGDSHLRQYWINVFYYQKTLDCAIIYSECYFQGDSLKICENQPITSLEAENWSGVNIKSVQVPFSRTLTLYDKLNLKGEYTQLQGDNECLDGQWQFN